ncbi:astacin (Peptidase family m12A) domain-containing protein [Ditylenchus destructor]|uniref:Metalloendopeptidase n=1 Tax=Ditylenchus destructor TaxID=166010 RepID=A0AAD4QRH0_9BILA|nr:astacin (Peptidase family m12A) domain-containing protein [Ditylenchus destructor]
MFLNCFPYVLATIALCHCLPTTKQPQPGDPENKKAESQPAPGGPPGPPPGFVPKVINFLLDQDESLTKAVTKLKESITPKRHVDPETAYKLLRGNSKRSDRGDRKDGKNVANELETVRDLLAKYRERVDKKNDMESGAGAKVAIKEELRKQSRMRAAEIKALLKSKGKVQSLIANPERGEELSEYLFEGDIVLSVEQAQQLVDNVAETGENPTTPEPTDPEKPGPSKRSKRGALNFATFPSNKWDKNEIVPYAFDSSIESDPSKKSQIEKAIGFWSHYTCFYFEETNPEDQSWYHPIITFKNSTNTCSSPVGAQMDQYNQVVLIGDGCVRMGTIAHEIAHSLGFWHTMSRHDRGTFVTVDFDNVEQVPVNKTGNFKEQSTTTNDNQGIKYDYGAVMQYDAHAFNKDPDAPTIYALEDNMMQTMGQRVQPAFSDIVMMNKAYGCFDACTSADMARCKNGGYPNPNWCDTQCICPQGFGGSDCSTKQESTAGASCGAVLNATTSWTSFTGSLNPGVADSGTNDYESCHWHINSPPGTKVWLWIDTISSTSCDIACTVSSVEFKVKEFDRTGHRMCCQSDLGSGGYIQIGGYTNKAIVSLLSRSRAQNFRAYHIYV